jgi:hypothetical protein
LTVSLPSGGVPPRGAQVYSFFMGRHTAERGPANDLFMATILAALLLLSVIILTLAAN